MRTRFGRGRRGSRARSDGGRAPIDAERWLTRLREEKVVSASELAPIPGDEVPDTFAVVGLGKTESESPLLVGFAPRSGGDALLAVLAVASRLTQEGSFDGQVIAVAPQWDASARARLGVMGEPAGNLRFRAVSASSLDEAGAQVAPDIAGVFPVPPERVADGLTSPEARDLFLRALAAFEGLAAKHGGAVRGTPDSVELVLMAQRVAALRATGARVVLETMAPERSTSDLERSTLAAALDRLEGQLRKRLNDRRVRGSEEGVRARALGSLAEVAGLRSALAWPAPSRDGEVLDLAGLDADGRPVLAAIRNRIHLPELGAVLDAALAIRPALPVLFADAAGPLRLAAPRLALAAGEFAPAALHALAALTLDHALFDLHERRSGEVDVLLRGEGAGAPASSQRLADTRPADRSEPGEGRGQQRSSRQRGRGRGRSGGGAAAPGDEGRARGGEGQSRTREEPSRTGEGASRAGEGASRAGEGSSRDRDSRARGGEEQRGDGGSAAAKEPREQAQGFDDISLFDLDDDARNGEEQDEDGQRVRRRRRGRRRGRRSNGAEEAPAEEGDSPALEDDDDVDTLIVDADDPAEALAPIEELVSEVEVEPVYDDDDDEAGEASEESWTEERERELRRRARAAKASPEPAPEEPQKRPRRRSAIVVHADRDSVAAGVLLARDIRQVEGFWVYPQEDLMTFFRGVATDLRPETPILLVGFTARPARDTIQAASLYAGRLVWFDHHDWPPEDLVALRSTLGEENVLIEPGSGSSLPAALADRTRRSRFSDKLVELFTGRFSQHDYERWGQLWWHRIGEIAKTSGEKRHSIDPLLAGRPSDLAREAGRSGTPPVPQEVTFVSERDFRLVHFGGFTLVVVAVPASLDPHLVARVARERFGAQMSLAYPEDSELVLLGADDTRGRGGLDLAAMVSHLAAKHEWIEALRDEDYAARMRVRDMRSRPERLDEVVSEIAMGRALLEG